MLTHLEMVGRIAAGAALGGAIGYERDRHGRPVGLRTHFIVALTAATFMVISSQSVQGLTTAAGMWLVTAIGMSAGAGMFVESLTVTLLGLLALTLLRRFEDKRDDVLRRRITISVRPGPETLGVVRRELSAACLELSDLEYEQRFSDEGLLVMSFEVVLGVADGVATVLDRLHAIPGIERVQVQRMH